jgi:hypothetical protein
MARMNICCGHPSYALRRFEDGNETCGEMYCSHRNFGSNLSEYVLTFPRISQYESLRIGKLRQQVLGRSNRLISLIWQGMHRKRRVQKLFYSCLCIVACVFISVVRFLCSRCLATLREYTHTHTHTHTQLWEFIK